MSVPAPRPMPPHDVPAIDPKTGKLNPDWRRYFETIEKALRALVALS